MRKLRFALAVVGVMTASQSRGEPWYQYEWPCSGYEYGNAPLIYEPDWFPAASPPGLTVLSGLTFTDQLVYRKKHKTASVGITVVLGNRREGRPPGYAQLLFHSVHRLGAAEVLHPVSFPPIPLVEGDVVKVGIACTLNGKVPKNRPPRVLYSIDFN